MANLLPRKSQINLSMIASEIPDRQKRTLTPCVSHPKLLTVVGMMEENLEEPMSQTQLQKKLPCQRARAFVPQIS